MTKLVALTGAGISKASGIPTFVEMGDLRQKLSREYFNNHREKFYKVLAQMKEKIDSAEPNDAHLALAEYEVPIVTMNIDGLHKRAGSKNVIEIHGNFEFVACNNCNKNFEFEITNKSTNCPICNSPLEPNIVLYGDMIPRLYDAIDLVAEAHRFLVVGTSFYTSTAGYLTDVARRKGIEVDIINERAETEVRKYLTRFFSKDK